MIRRAPLLAALLLPGCLIVPLADRPPVREPVRDGKDLALHRKAAVVEDGLDDRHLLPWGVLSYRVGLPPDTDVEPLPIRIWYQSDTAAWTGVLLASESERWALQREDEALDRVKTLLEGITVLFSVNGERGLFARYVHPVSLDGMKTGGGRAVTSFLKENNTERWHDGTGPWEGWHWHGEASKDQVAGVVCGLSAVLDFVEDEWCRARASRLLSDLADRVFGRGYFVEDPDGPTRFGDMRPRVYGFPVGVHAAVMCALGDAAWRATGSPRHRRRLERLEREGALEALRYPTIRIATMENWNNANMTAMALSSILRRSPADGADFEGRFHAAAADSMRRILGLHRGEGNAYWIAVAAPAGTDAGVTEQDLEDARTQLRRFPTDRRDEPVDLRGLTDRSLSWWCSRRGRPQFEKPLTVDRMAAGAFVWKSYPFEAIQEFHGSPNVQYAGTDFLAAYWPLRRLGVIGPGE